MALAGTEKDLEAARRYDLPPELIDDDEPEDLDEDDEVAHLRNSDDSIDEKRPPTRFSRPQSPSASAAGREDEGAGYAYAAGPLTGLPVHANGANGNANGSANGSAEGAGKRAPRRREPPKHGKGVLCGGLLALLALAYFFTLFATSGTRYGHSRKVNVILMISDGFGPAAETLTRTWVQHMHEHVPESRDGRWGFMDGFKDKHGVQDGGFGFLPLDPLLVGSSRTRSSDSLVTDSAAGATAFSCGIKTYNGGIAVNPKDGTPCGTVLEAAKHRGYLTGLVATSRITHATPAAFYSHVVDRDLEADIAPFLIGDGPLGHVVDLAFGGGERFFRPKGADDSSRNDEIDLLQIAEEEKGYKVLRSREDFEGWWDSGKGQTNVPVLGLFNLDHMNYEVDRMTLTGAQREPSLRNMTLAALQTLSKAAKDKKAHGFFAMIEGSRIDMAEHTNDPVGTLYDVLAYQETVRTVKAWVDEANKAGWPTVMISVSDHETGGLSLGRQLTSSYPEYAWYPEVLANATNSAEFLAQRLSSHQGPLSKDYLVHDVLHHAYGIEDPSDHEVDQLIKKGGRNEYLLADMISRRAQVAWGTHGHSGVDVNLYAYGEDAEKLAGNHENTEICEFIKQTMMIDLAPVSADLVRNLKSWHKPKPSLFKNGNRLKLKAYSHEF